MAKSILAGIDFSMTCPSACVHSAEKDNDEFSFKNCSFFFLTAVKKYARDFCGQQISGFYFDKDDFIQEIERYDEIAGLFVDWLDAVNCTEVALEGYAFGAKGRVFHIGECTGLLKYQLWQSGRILSVYEPTVIKKFATGKGNAKKDQMYEAFVKETDVDLKAQLNFESSKIVSPISDLVDSYFICKYLYYNGILVPKLPLATS